MGGSQMAAAEAGVKTSSLVFEDIAQLFFQLPLGKHVLDAAPRGLATFAHGNRFGAALRTLNQRIEVMRFFGLAKKLVVDLVCRLLLEKKISREFLDITKLGHSPTCCCPQYRSQPR